jgi:hypothetical protein
MPQGPAAKIIHGLSLYPGCRESKPFETACITDNAIEAVLLPMQPDQRSQPPATRHCNRRPFIQGQDEKGSRMTIYKYTEQKAIQWAILGLLRGPPTAPKPRTDPPVFYYGGGGERAPLGIG